MSELYSYKAYGLGICSSLAFPELVTEKILFKEVIIRLGNEKSFPSNYIDKKLPTNLDLVHYGDNDAGILFKGRPLIRVRHGKEIIISSNSRNIDDFLLRSFVLYQGMGLILHQRGLLVLHGSVVNIKGGAVAFVGESHSGKSTLVSYMNKSGYPLVTDEILAIKFNGKNKPVILPGLPKIKLLEDVINFFNYKNPQQNEIYYQIGKYYVDVKNFNLNPLELKLIYVLERAKKSQIVSLNTQDSIKELIKNSYMNIHLNKEERTENLFLCAKIFKMVPIKILKRPNSFDKLKDILLFLENDVENEL